MKHLYKREKIWSGEMSIKREADNYIEQNSIIA